MIPTYNAPDEYLEQALRSVLEQDPGPQHMQIEVVDSCSPNGAPVELVRRLAGDRVTVHRANQNTNMVGNWNRCIERARGEWVHILHHDDLVYAGFYDSLRRGLEKHPDSGAAFCRHAYCDDQGHWHRLSLLERPDPGLLENFVELLVAEERMQCAAMVVRRSTYEQLGGFSPVLTHTLDWEMWIRIASRYPIYYEPKILACWRNHTGATTSKQIQSGENIRDHVRAIQLWSSYLPADKAPRLAALARKRFAGEGLWMAEHLLIQKKYSGCLNQVSAALTCDDSPRLQMRAARIRAKVALAKAKDKFRPLKHRLLGP